MSPDHFTRVFKEATGWSPSEYFQMRRVHHACNMLLNAETNISEVAYRLGYADAAHLSRVLKRFRGISPREYRKSFVS
jgi:AraC family transcriptional regulator